MSAAIEERRAEARRLQLKEGLTVREIADRLGVSPGTAHRYLNPKAHARYRRKTAEWKRRQRRENHQKGAKK